MSLYQISQEIERLQNRVSYDNEIEAYVDLDTGEILTDEELNSMFAELGMEKKEILEWMAKCVINDRSEAEAIKAEEKRLAERRKRFEKRAERFLSIIDRECAGENTNLGVATMKYTLTRSLETTDEEEAMQWLEASGHEDMIRVKKELKKTEIKKLIQSGTIVPGVEIAERKSASLK